MSRTHPEGHPARRPHRRRRNPLTPAFERFFGYATVTDVEQVTRSMRRIRLVVDEPLEFAYAPGQHVRIELKDPLSLSGILRPVETLRTYTIWELDREQRAIELRAHLYDGDGIGLRWALRAAPGDRLRFWWPRNTFHPRQDAPYHLFAGEETAAAAFGPMLRSLDGSTPVWAALESATPADDLPLPRESELHRVHRDGAPATSSKVLLDAVAGLPLPDHPGVAYVAGEAKTSQMIRDHLVRERGWPRSAVTVKPFWAPGKRGLH